MASGKIDIPSITYVTTETVTPSDTGKHFIEINKPVEGNCKGLTLECIAPSSNANLSMQMWIQGLNHTSTTSLIRYKAEAENQTYTILAMFFY